MEKIEFYLFIVNMQLEIGSIFLKTQHNSGIIFGKIYSLLLKKLKLMKILFAKVKIALDEILCIV
jgi:hypothetical protein